jgi:hypothetical protein
MHTSWLFLLFSFLGFLVCAGIAPIAKIGQDEAESPAVVTDQWGAPAA